MREIKFRVWDKKENRFLGEDEFVIDNNGRVYRWLNDNTLELIKHSVELLQYTGLKDKNGVEIFDGDVVKIGVDFGYGTQPLIGEVLFDKCSFIYRHKSQGDLSLFGIDSNDWCEVIGNIYENNELLESEK